MQKKNVISIVLAFLSCTCLSGTAYAQFKPTPLAAKHVETRSIDEIKQFYREHPFSTTSETVYEVLPDKARCIEGTLSQETIQNGLNALNFIRYVAGVPADVTIDETYQSHAQKGTLLLSRAGALTHTPEKTDDMPLAFYNAGYDGTSNSNISQSNTAINLANHIVYSWMEDPGQKNLEHVGHRRWCLDPTLEKTGFGVYNYQRAGENCYGAMYVISPRRTASEIDYIPWPAQTMPYEYCQGPWSVSLNPDKYDLARCADSVSVTMYSKATQATYVLDRKDKDKNGRYFNVSLTSYGRGPAIVFTPGVPFSPNDEVQVTISGLRQQNGASSEIAYSVKFFELHPGSNNYISKGPYAASLSQSNQWLTANGQKYWLDPSGHMATGWRCIDHAWYYFNADGSMLTDSWLTDGGHRYYLKADGKMKTGWLNQQGTYYYLDYSGRLQTNTIIADTYVVDANGAWIY